MQIRNGSTFTAIIFCLLFCEKEQALWAQTRGVKPLLVEVKNDLTKDTLVARNILAYADSLSEASQEKRAVEKCMEALPYYQKHQLWADYVSVYVTISVICDYLAETEKEKYANLAVELGEQYLESDHPVMADAYRQKAEALSLLGRPKDAIAPLKKSIPIFHQHQQWVSESWSEIILSNCYYSLKQIDSMAGCLARVEKLHKDHNLDDDIGSSILDCYGVMYISLGDYEKAIRTSHQSLSILLRDSSIDEVDSLYITRGYQKIGFMQAYKGDYLRALDTYFHALSWQPVAFFQERYKIFYRIGEAYFKLRNYREAIPYLNKSIEISKINMRKYLGVDGAKRSFQNLAECYFELDEMELAQKSLNQAKAISAKELDHTIWETQAWLDLEAGKTDAAIVSLGKAMQAINKSTEFKYYQSRILLKRGDAYWKKGERERALLDYQKSIAAVSNNSENEDVYNVPSLSGVRHPAKFLRAIHAKAKALAEMSSDPKALPAALATYKVAIQWIDSLRAKYVTDNSELSWGKTFQEIYEGSMHTAWRMYEQTVDKECLIDMFMISEKSKSALLLETLKAHQNQATLVLSDSIRNREKDLAMDIAFYSQELKKVKDAKDSVKTILFQTYLSEKQLAMARHKEWLQKTYPVSLSTKKEIQLADIQTNLLDEKTAMITYFTSKKYVYALVITQNEIRGLLLDIHSETIADFQRSLLSTPTHSAEAKKMYTTFSRNSHAAYLQVFESIADVLPAEITKLILIPDGYLNRLPFEVLTQELVETPSLDFGSLPFLLYQYSIRYGYSASLLVNNKNRIGVLKASEKCLAFAPPYKPVDALTSQRGEGFRGDASQLNGTAQEVDAISRYFKGKFETTEKATVEAFRKEAGKYGILHLAMHGKADFDRPGFGYLIFSNMETSSNEEAYLYNYEISQLELKAQLAVLSACETGVGQYLDGEGVFSIARGFMNAGVPSVVMSLWQVNDRSTSELMPVFYKYLAEGLPKDEALYKAKKDFISSCDMMKTHPFYWTGFVLLGDDAPVRSSIKSWIWLGLVLLILGLSGIALWQWKRKKQCLCG